MSRDIGFCSIMTGVAQSWHLNAGLTARGGIAQDHSVPTFPGLSRPSALQPGLLKYFGMLMQAPDPTSMRQQQILCDAFCELNQCANLTCKQGTVETYLHQQPCTVIGQATAGNLAAPG